MKHVNTILLIVWTAAFFHAAYHEDVARTAVCILFAALLNVSVVAAEDAIKPDILAQLVWRTLQLCVNAWLLITATVGVEQTWSCILFSKWGS